jgi:type II secretory pathway pseudopilin PulG
MKLSPPDRCQAKPSEEGYILVAVIFMLAIMIIALTVAAPKIAKSIQRERELETMHRGKQYSRAVKLYYKKFGAYPANLEALVNTNNVRFLRKKYIDPTTGKDEWKVVRVGQQKTQTLGFFGQPIGGAGVPGAGLAGANSVGGIGGATGGSSIGGFGSSGSFGSNSGSSILGGATGSSGSSTDPSGSSGATSGSNGTDPGNGQNGGTGAGATGTGGTGTTGTDPGSGSAFGTPGGQTFGGIGIMGFSPNSPKQSILVYKKKNHYSDWEFLYDPLAEQMMQGGNLGTIGQPVGNQPGGGTLGGGGGIGSGIGGSTFGPSGGTNPGGSTPTSPTTPQQ